MISDGWNLWECRSIRLWCAELFRWATKETGECDEVIRQQSDCLTEVTPTGARTLIEVGVFVVEVQSRAVGLMCMVTGGGVRRRCREIRERGLLRMWEVFLDVPWIYGTGWYRRDVLLCHLRYFRIRNCSIHIEIKS